MTQLTATPLLIAMNDLAAAGIAAATLIVGVLAGATIVSALRGKTLGQARAEASQLRQQAEGEARTLTQKAQIDAERIVLEKRQAFEAEQENARKEIRETERRLSKREDLLDKKLESLEEKDRQLTRQTEQLKSKEEALARRTGELDDTIRQQKDKLLQIAGMSLEQAKQELLQRVEGDARQEMAKVTARIVEEATSEAKAKAQEITLMAVQRYAAEHTAESTVRAVPIPNDDMKGRIIGREGRNIRAIEKATGVDIIVDDTPGVIVVSCFDKIRQAVAVESLNRLIADGRMRPARGEEVVEKVKTEMDERVLKSGKEAVLEVNLRGLHPKLVEAMGKLSFRTSYGQNVLRHSVEVAYVSQIIADQLGLDGTLARLPARHRQGDGPRDGGRPPEDRDGLCAAVRREGGRAQRHRRPPRRHPQHDVLHANRHGCRRGVIGKAGRTAREHGEVHPAAQRAAGHRPAPAGRDRGVRNPGRPRGPGDGGCQEDQ